MVKPHTEFGAKPRSNPWGKDPRDFYRTRRWKTLSKRIRRKYKDKCLICKSKGKLVKSTLVHHDLPLRKFPEHAYSEWVRDTDGNLKRQLWPICRDCHEEIEIERGTRSGKADSQPLTEEWW